VDEVAAMVTYVASELSSATRGAVHLLKINTGDHRLGLSEGMCASVDLGDRVELFSTYFPMQKVRICPDSSVYEGFSEFNQFWRLAGDPEIRRAAMSS
jgi:acid phosphatase class B